MTTYHPDSVVEDSSNTFISAITLKSSKEVITIDEPVTFSLSFKVLGHLREVFTQSMWEKAYDAHDTTLRLTYILHLYKVLAHVVKRNLVKPLKFVRRGTLYWSKDPNLPYRIWAMIISEDRIPNIPKNIDEARSLLFDVNKTFDLLGSDLGEGAHNIQAKVKVRWGKHSYIEPNSVENTSSYLKLFCR